MKTMNFQIECCNLYDRQNNKHVQEAENLKIKPIDIVVCNLYPFEKTVEKDTTTIDEAVENIDVGGPTMVRAAAKNYKNCLVVIDPKDYENIVNYLSRHSGLDPESPKKILNQVQDDDNLDFKKA